MHTAALDRRRFLVGVIAFGGSASALRNIVAWAQSDVADRVGANTTLVRMARQLYPHDALDDAVYAQILDDALSAAAADTSIADALQAAETALDARRGRAFVDLDAETQLAVMREVEELDFFTVIQTAVRLRLYNHPAFWSLIGYEGPSWQNGGYLNRGAGDIDWLPEVR